MGWPVWEREWLQDGDEYSVRLEDDGRLCLFVDDGGEGAFAALPYPVALEMRAALTRWEPRHG